MIVPLGDGGLSRAAHPSSEDARHQASGAPRPTHRSAARVLAERDAVIAGLVASTGLPRFVKPQESHFAALVRSVLYQQLAGAAAAAIHARLLQALDQDVDPHAFLGLSPETLRAVGLSRNKAAALQDLAAKVIGGTVELDPRRLAREADEEVITRLCLVRGIGPWTAQMFLMFQLRRLDVWPAGDLGVRRGYGLAYDVPSPAERDMAELGARYAPYRSVAAWYCWRACEVYAASDNRPLR